MNIQLSDRVNNIKPSPTLSITAKAAELKAAGKNILSLGAGEPDFDTPMHIKQAGINAINNGFTKYTAVGGIPGLKNAIINKFTLDNNLEYTPNQILVSCGAKQSIYNLVQALLNPNDEVVIPSPYWVSYPDICILAGAKIKIANCTIEQNFKLTPNQLANILTPNTKLLFLNSPSNPTGVAYTKAELAALGEVLEDYPNTFILSDDIYEHILWAKEPFSNILNACPNLYDRTIVINGVSKAYSMTGWRIGYAAGPEQLIKAMTKIQSQSTSNPCSISQQASISALNGGLECVEIMVKQFKARHDFLVKELNNIPGINCLQGDGAFYAFPQVEELIDMIPNITTDLELSELLLNEAELALVPGSAFGSPGYLRLSFATSMEILQEALTRLNNFVKRF